MHCWNTDHCIEHSAWLLKGSSAPLQLPLFWLTALKSWLASTGLKQNLHWMWEKDGASFPVLVVVMWELKRKKGSNVVCGLNIIYDALFLFYWFKNCLTWSEEKKWSLNSLCILICNLKLTELLVLYYALTEEGCSVHLITFNLAQLDCSVEGQA